MIQALRRGRTQKRIVVYLTILFYLLVVMLPIYWMFRTSITENESLYGVTLSFFPDKLTLTQFDQAISKWRFGYFLVNSIIVAV
jgi:ABC-type glycerol-3-phosphate transport system permease component